MRLKLLLLSLVFVFFTGCSNSTQTMNNSVKIDERPKYQIPAKIEPPKKRAKGSLFSGRMNSLFTDRKELQLGDIVFITISETQKGVKTYSDKNTILTDDGRTQAGGSLDNVPSTSFPLVGGILDKSASILNRILGVGFSLPSRTANNYAEGQSNFNYTLDEKITAVVTEHYQNGNYLVEGLKYIVISGQKHTLKISGVLNPQLLSGFNIESKDLANLKVIYFKEGDEQEYMEKPWGTKLLETISPF